MIKVMVKDIYESPSFIEFKLVCKNIGCAYPVPSERKMGRKEM
jgi:hypothetical protein